MTGGSFFRLSFSPRFKLFFLLAGPCVLLLIARLVSLTPGFRTDRAEDLLQREQDLAAAFGSLLTEASAMTASVLDATAVPDLESLRRGRLGERLEGLALLQADLEFSSWEGMPAEPPARFNDPAWPDWTVRVDGVRTRLLVRAGPGGRGQFALATFVIDSLLEENHFLDLLPRDLGRGVQIEVVFEDTEGRYGPYPRNSRDDAAKDLVRKIERDVADQRVGVLRSPSGEVLATASLIPLQHEHRVARLLATGQAWAVALYVVLLAVLFDWTAVRQRWSGLASLAGLVIFARWLLIWQDVPARLLPREIGSPSLYGSSHPWDLLASPADLLLTAVAVYLLCIAARDCCVFMAEANRPGAVLSATAFAGAATAAGIGLTLSLARNSRIALLERPAPFEWDGRLALWIGLFLLLLGAAELWRLLWTLPRATDESRRRPVGRVIPLALAFLALSLCMSLLLQQRMERLAVEQLGSEIAPHLLEQSSRRRVALLAGMKEIQESYEIAQVLAGPLEGQQEFLAYHYWVRGELFHSRYKSSLDLYGPDGTPISRFGFDLPPLDETVRQWDQSPFELQVAEEALADPARTRKLLHVEVPVFHDGRLVAVAIGHVLDEPDNLPFLPWSRPYLAALGPGSPRQPGEEFAGGPDYVLYDADGAITLTTLGQPPAQTGAMRRAASRGDSLTVMAGGEPHLGLPVSDEGRSLHLLLLPKRGPAERMATSVRLALLGLLLLVLLTLVTQFRHPGGGQALIRLLRGSFYRKLLAALLIASAVPLVGLALFLRAYIERRGDAALVASATQVVGAAQQVLEDYAATTPEGQLEPAELNDLLLYWLRRVVGQEIHVYNEGVLLASSKRELFASGLLPLRLEGRVQHKLVREGLPSLVVSTVVGPSTIPVAYAPLRLPDRPSRQLIVAVPLVLEQQQIAQATARVAEMILLATVALVGLLAVVAAFLARTVARPVRELVEATSRIAAGHYSTRLEPLTQDEVAELVRGFNTMASALARQRADLERRRDYIETLLRHATTGVISVDADERIVTHNPAVGQLLLPCDEQLQVGRDLDEVLASCAELGPLVRALQAAAERPGEPVEVDLFRDQEPRRLRLVRVELRRASGQSFGAMILLDDVTDLMRSNQLAAWAEMARAIAHEIKNPLTPIQLSAEHLRRLLQDKNVLPSANEEACLETIIKQVRALYEIAGEFSTYAKLPSLALEPTDPVAFMHATIGPYLAAQPPGVSIEEQYDPTPQVAIDRKVLARALVNLVENALQAMTDGGSLIVAVGEDEREGRVRLSVRDTGPGLAPEVRSRLFEPYFSTKSSGTGLGLAIARRAVEAHQGSIEVDSQPGQGTAFHILLPVHRS